MVEAELGAPLREGHAEVAAEQPGQGPAARPDPAAEFGALADTTSPQTALAPLVAMPLLSWLLFRTLPEPCVPGPRFGAAEEADEAAVRTAKPG